MPAKNSIKDHLKLGYFYIYNQGLNKQEIFLDHQDYETFLSLLKSYLSANSQDQISGIVDTRPFRVRTRLMMNLKNEIKLYSYCLLPHSFHLLVKQFQPRAMQKLLQRVCTSYVAYFNKKYHRIGTIFNGVYKAVICPNDDAAHHCLAEIHAKAAQTKKIGPFATRAGNPSDYLYSSYQFYANEASFPDWLMNFKG